MKRIISLVQKLARIAPNAASLALSSVRSTHKVNYCLLDTTANWEPLRAILTLPLLLLIAAMPGTAGPIYVLNGINIGGNFGNHVSTIGEYNTNGQPVNTAMVSAPGANLQSIALAENLTVNGVPGPKLYVADQNNNKINVYDAVTGVLVKASLVPSVSSPYSVAVYGSKLFVISGTGMVGEYDAVTGAPVNASIGYVTFAQSMAVSSAGSGGVNLFVTSNNSGSAGSHTGTVARFTMSPSGTVSSSNKSLVSKLNFPEGIAVSPDGLILYIVEPDSGRVGKYDSNTGLPINTTLVAGLVGAWGIAVSADGSSLFVTLTGNGVQNGNGRIGEYAAASGSTVNSALVTGLSNPTGIAVWNQCTPPPAGLTAWWTLDETTPLATGYSDLRNMGLGRAYGGVQVVTGEVGNAARFNGLNQYIEVTALPAAGSPMDIGPASYDGSGDFSIDAWVRLDQCSPVLSCAADSGVRVILEKRTFSSAQYKGYSFYLYNQYLGLQLADGGVAPGYTNYGASALVVPADGQWHFVAVSVARPSTTGYRVQFTLDNKPSVAINSPARFGSFANNSNVRIGMLTISNGSVFNGSIDEVEFFRRAVTHNEWQAIYDAGTCGKCR